MTVLAAWENFYVIVGSSAGALIGLQFVVITLIADTPIAQGQAQAGDAFATPTIVHFGAVEGPSFAARPGEDNLTVWESCLPCFHCNKGCRMSRRSVPQSQYWGSA